MFRCCSVWWFACVEKIWKANTKSNWHNTFLGDLYILCSFIFPLWSFIVSPLLSIQCDSFLLLSRSDDVFQRAESSFGPWAHCRPAASDGLLLHPASSQRLWPGHWEHCPIRSRWGHAWIQCPHASPSIIHTLHVVCSCFIPARIRSHPQRDQTSAVTFARSSLHEVH